MNECRYPHLAASSGYTYGCRCDRCAGWHRHYEASRPPRPPRARPPRPPRPPRPSALERILERIVVDPELGCWLVPTKSKRGYVGVYINGRSTTAHRFMAELYLGPIPPTLEVDHYVCDVRNCCNPDHLCFATHAENTARAVVRTKYLGKHTLDEDRVREIRRRRANGERLTILARAYGVDASTVHDAWSGRTWSEVAS